MELNEIKGIGINTIGYLNDLGIFDVAGLLTYYPFRYDVMEPSDMSKVTDGDRVIVCGICESIPNVYYFSKNMNKMSFRLNSGDKLYNITIFNRAFLKKNINVGVRLTVIGKYDLKHQNIVASDVRFGFISKTEIVPIYHASFNINSKRINKIVLKAFDYSVLDYVPDYLNEKYKFIDKNKAVRIVHNPVNLDELKQALAKLKYEELFVYMLRINALKKSNEILCGLERKIDYDVVIDRMKSLPFELTGDQKQSILDIYNDLTSSKRMNRLLQGDVGSGKTIVSFVALFINHLSGYQGALMAPTEILAQQHFENFLNLFPELKVSLLTGKTKAKERKIILNGLIDGSIDVVIGTHALISDSVSFYNLGLVITDEQHRFGVNQRANLKNKGFMPDILYMSATPIPRTYALTLYGDMDISFIKNGPKGRKDVKTYLKSNKEIKDVLYMMLKEIKLKHQIYVIAPLVEDSDSIDMENVYELETKMKKAFGKVCNIGILHGKMKSKEKEMAMDRFKRNEIQILICTTVIEVGVDVANATMVVIFDSYRFGLSALHQLRGRVGRNNLDSYCILISDKETKRLDILTHSNDGFKISEEDFKLRGSGDLFGYRQSGEMNFKIANVKTDFDLLVKTKDDSYHFINSVDYNLPKYSHIKKLTLKSDNLD